MLSDVGNKNVALPSENSKQEKHVDTEKHKNGEVKSWTKGNLIIEPKYARVGNDVVFTVGKETI